MNRQTGFTLIELVMVIVIIGILAAMAVPRFYNASNDAVLAAQQGSEAAVRSAHAIAIAEFKRIPTLAELAARVTFDGASASVAPDGDGVRIPINGTNYVVQTFQNSNCTGITGGGGENVNCVGNITVDP